MVSLRCTDLNFSRLTLGADSAGKAPAAFKAGSSCLSTTHSMLPAVAHAMRSVRARPRRKVLPVKRESCSAQGAASVATRAQDSGVGTERPGPAELPLAEAPPIPVLAVVASSA